MAEMDKKEITESDFEQKLRLTTLVVKPGLTKFQLMDAYKTWNSSIFYDEVAQNRGYNGPKKTAQCMADHIPETERRFYKIIDIGAGTGLVGEKLLAAGFETLDALEPSQDLMKTAKSKNVYRKFFQCFITDEVTPDIDDDSYDGLVTCGCFAENHLPVESVKETIRIVKPGGVIVIVTRLLYLETVDSYKDKLEPYMTQMETLGKWRNIHRQVFPKYYREDDGILWVYEKL